MTCPFSDNRQTVCIICSIPRRLEVMPMTLPEDGTEHHFPYDTYDTGTREFEKLLLSEEWNKMDEK